MSRVCDCDGDESYPNESYLRQCNEDRQISGKRGQSALRELEAALLALPEKRLVAGKIVGDGQVCTLGAWMLAKGIASGKTREEMLAELEGIGAGLDPDAEGEDYELGRRTAKAAAARGFPKLIAWAILWASDYDRCGETPEQLYESMLDWVRSNLKREAA